MTDTATYARNMEKLRHRNSTPHAALSPYHSIAAVLIADMTAEHHEREKAEAKRNGEEFEKTQPIIQVAEFCERLERRVERLRKAAA